MKKLFYVLLIGLFCTDLSAQNNNPFASIGKQGKILTLSHGKYVEVYSNDSLQRIGAVVMNMNTGKVQEYLDVRETEPVIEPKLLTRWYSLDPMASQSPSKSPYNFCSNNPINKIDPDGRNDYYLVGDNGYLLAIQITADQSDNFYRVDPHGNITFMQNRPFSVTATDPRTGQASSTSTGFNQLKVPEKITVVNNVYNQTQRLNNGQSIPLNKTLDNNNLTPPSRDQADQTINSTPPNGDGTLMDAYGINKTGTQIKYTTKQDTPSNAGRTSSLSDYQNKIVPNGSMPNPTNVPAALPQDVICNDTQQQPDGTFKKITDDKGKIINQPK